MVPLVRGHSGVQNPTEPLQSPIKADYLQWTSFVTVQFQQTSYVTFLTLLYITRQSMQFVLEIYGQGWGKQMVTWKQRSQHIQITSSEIGSLSAHYHSTSRWLSFKIGIEKLKNGRKQSTPHDRFIFWLFPPQPSHLNSNVLCLTLSNHVIWTRNCMDNGTRHSWEIMRMFV